MEKIFSKPMGQIDELPGRTTEAVKVITNAAGTVTGIQIYDGYKWTEVALASAASTAAAAEE